MNRPKKRLSQNFLTDSLVISKILDVINPKEDERFFEIGSGKGALTKMFVDRVKVMESVEIDKDLLPKLKQLELSSNNLRIHEGNILKFNLDSLSENKHKYRVVGNLPYNISSKIMMWSFKNMKRIEDLHFMFQKEFGERLISNPGNKSYGRLSILTQYMFESFYLFKILPESFTPKPSVESIFIRFIPRQRKDINSPKTKKLQEITHMLFSKRRKKISTSFKKILSKNELIDLRVNPDDRPELLEVRDFLRLTEYLLKKNNV